MIGIELADGLRSRLNPSLCRRRPGSQAEHPRQGVLRLLLDLPQVRLALEAFGVDLVNVLRA